MKIGIMASQISGHLYTPAASYESIATNLVTSTVQSVTFSSIPTGFAHLQLRFIMKTADSDIRVQVNGDGTTNYYSNYITANGTTITSGGQSGTSARMGYFGNNTSNIFGAGITDIVDYRSANKYKTIRAWCGGAYNSAGQFEYVSSIWKNQNAITSLTIVGANIQANSHFALYGVK